MKAIIDVPDELYRRVKAKTALLGRAVRDVTIELYQRRLSEPDIPPTAKDDIVITMDASVWIAFFERTDVLNSACDDFLTSVRDWLAWQT